MVGVVSARKNAQEKKFIIQRLAVLLAVIIIISLLAGCANGNEQVSNPDSDMNSGMSSISNAPEGDINFLEHSFISTIIPFPELYEDTTNIESSIDCLEEMQSAIYTSNVSIEGIIHATESCMGVERRLTKAIKSLVSELQGYLTMTNMMVSSIDRIISRSSIMLEEKTTDTNKD